jgi:hypothetical protein
MTTGVKPKPSASFRIAAAITLICAGLLFGKSAVTGSSSDDKSRAITIVFTWDRYANPVLPRWEIIGSNGYHDQGSENAIDAVRKAKSHDSKYTLPVHRVIPDDHARIEASIQGMKDPRDYDVLGCKILDQHGKEMGHGSMNFDSKELSYSCSASF